MYLLLTNQDKLALQTRISTNFFASYFIYLVYIKKYILPHMT